jgi:pimeloyl-ACP methyl ester carboxylesterase
MRIPFIDYGGSGAQVHFLHANGYPPACYRPLLRLLTAQYHTICMLLRPLWKGSNPAEINDWDPFSEDFLRLLDEQKCDRVIAIGHSIGATVTLRTALKEPNRFQALVLIEPVIFPLYFILGWNLVRAFGLGNRLNPKIEGALKRRREFDDLDQVFTGYRRRDIFRFFSDENLRSLISGMTIPKTTNRNNASSMKEYELAYSPEWEARIYSTSLWHDWDLWRGISRLEVPTLILRGAYTDTFWESTSRSITKRNSKVRIVTLEKSTHLLPFEKPLEVFDITRSFLGELGLDFV